MDILKLILRNSLRHRLRTLLTAFGISIALLSFCFIQTVIDAWYSGVEASAKNRIISRNAVSLIFYLPLSYRGVIESVPGVAKVGYGNWFGGRYKDETFRFAQFAIDNVYLDVYPEFQIRPDQRREYEADRQGALLGAELAEKFGVKVGDVIQLQGTIFPGLWQYTVRAIFTSQEGSGDERTMFMHWDYLNERNKREINRQPDHVGYFVIQLEPGADPAVVSRAIDERFANTYAETLTETETAFQQSFVSMSSTIILAMNVISLVVIVIMLLVLSNTMILSARERFREYSVLKAIGFSGGRLASLIAGESLLITLLGFLILCAMLAVIFSLPPSAILGDVADFFPVFQLNPLNVVYCFAAALVVGALAAAIPAYNMFRLNVIEGLRRLA